MKNSQTTTLPEYLRDEYPFASHRHALRDLSMHYLDEGTGSPVLMLHGNPSWSFYYRNLVSVLKENHRCIVPDHIGCGLSDKPDDRHYNYTLTRRVQDLESLIESLALDSPFHLVMHDWGGMIGMRYAVTHPEQIRSLVVLNTAAFPLPESKPFPWALWLCRNTRLGALLVRGGNAFSRGAAWVGCKRTRMPRKLRDAYCYPYNTWGNRIATLRFVQDIPLRLDDPGYELVSDTAANLSLFRQYPMLIGWGLKDFVFDKHFLKEWRRRFPDAEQHVYNDAGHYVLEDARDTLIPAITSFIHRADAGATSDISSTQEGDIV